MSHIKTIAFYLPQFYPTPENNEWWGKGFTEWTNVARAKPLFPGHYQPRIPADLGFYDLRVPSVREEQVKLAKEAGIDGFCYWHYWFAGRRLLDHVFTEVVESGKPDFPFCLCWANHSWSQKTWDVNKPDKLLIEQTYPGENDYVAHFMAMLPAFRDERYIRINGRLLFGVYSPPDIPDSELFFKTWNTLAEKYGLGGFCFFGFSQADYTKWQDQQYDFVVYDCLNEVFNHPELDGPLLRLKKRINRKILKRPYTTNYDNYVNYAIRYYSERPQIIPCIDPDFDHSPRSGGKWVIMDGSTPQKWGHLFKEVKKISSDKTDYPLVFIKAWNEWGEGNYLEPDMRWGRQYLDEMK